MWKKRSEAQHSGRLTSATKQKSNCSKRKSTYTPATLENPDTPLVVANPAGEIKINKMELLAIIHALLLIPSHQPAIIATDSLTA